MSNKFNIAIKEIEVAIKMLDESDDFKAAYDLYKTIKDLLDKSDLKSVDPELYKKYIDALVRTKFLALNFFDDWEEVGDLIKDHLSKALEFKYYDLWNKIEIKLLMTDNLDERDEMKNDLIKKMSESDDAVISKGNYPNNPKLPIIVADWIKDININVGYKNVSSFEKTKYLTNSANIVTLKEDDKRKIKILFEFYEKLKLSSKTKEGFEDEVPVVVNGETYIFHRGQAEPLKNVLKYMRDISGPPQSETEKNVANLQAQKQTMQGLAGKVIDEEIDNTKKIEDLQIMGSKYKDNSLQKRAIEEEIKKLES